MWCARAPAGNQHRDPRRDIGRKRDPGLRCGAEKKPANDAGDLKGCACHGPAQSDEQRPGILRPAARLWRPLAGTGEVEAAADMPLANQPSACSRCALPTLSSSPADHWLSGVHRSYRPCGMGWLALIISLDERRPVRRHNKWLGFRSKASRHDGAKGTRPKSETTWLC